MAMEEEFKRRLKACQRRNEPPQLWLAEMTKCVIDLGGTLPSPDLGEAVVSQLCFSHNHPSLWKFLDHALSSALLCPLHVLSLLTSRVVARRGSQPESYHLYLQLLKRYALYCGPLPVDAMRKIIKSVDGALNLSQLYGIQGIELGHTMVLYFYTVIIQLIDSVLEDLGLQMQSLDGASNFSKTKSNQNMGVHRMQNQVSEQNERQESLKRANTLVALDVLAEITTNRKGLALLRLVYLNMYKIFRGLLKRVHILESHKSSLEHLESESQLLLKFSVNVRRALDMEYHLDKHGLIRLLVDANSHKSSSTSEAGRISCWVAFDISMENAMDGKQFLVTSAVDILAEIIYTLQVFNKATWQETFLALWLSALRLVQRERDPLEGPVPHLEARLCILLSIVPLAVARVLEDDSIPCFSSLVENNEYEHGDNGGGCGKGGNNSISKRKGLISSLQTLGQYSTLLCPPASIIAAANNAAAKATSFVSMSKNIKSGSCKNIYHDVAVNGGGNMRHLIVEACIARNLINTSVYFWPGFVSLSTSISDQSYPQRSPWSKFMEGSPLEGSLVNDLIATPASSLKEIEKLYHIALSGTEKERPLASEILSGASLSHGWNIQEHVVHFVVKLLSPPVLPNSSESRNYLVDHIPMLRAVLYAVASIDNVHILSLYGMVPEVAAALIPICEAFGSLVPTSNQRSSTYDDSSIYMVFSSAFLFLMRLWKFYKPPLEQGITGRGGAIGCELTLEYLLLLHNSRIQSPSHAGHAATDSNADIYISMAEKPIYIDSYPKLRAWYCQNKSCIASTISGLCSQNPVHLSVHQVANRILYMLYSKMIRSGVSSSNSSIPSSSIMSCSKETSAEDAIQQPLFPAWEVLEAMPLVLEAILTACAHGRLSSRDLTTGLRDLVDFLPASLAAIISYFSAEVTRGIWRLVPMNGIDWPSPAGILESVESEIKEILAAVGVKTPSSSSEVSPAMLPLPLAALVSLTITFKLDKSLEYIHAVVGPALESCASCISWPSMPIIGSLWAQKVRRWHDFIVVSCSRSIFRQNQEAVAQLLRSCFTSFLGSPDLKNSSFKSQTGVNALLGSFISSPGLQPQVAPGFLYLRSCRTIHHLQCVNDVILRLLAEFSHKLGATCVAGGFSHLNATGASLSFAVSRAKQLAALGASLLCVAGGLQLVQELYQETIPTWLLCSRKEKLGHVSAVSKIIEGFSMANLVVMSGALIWGTGSKQPSWAHSRRSHMVGSHMDFLARILDREISLECDPITWKAYVSCVVGLVVSYAPIWIQEVKQETIMVLACRLRGWQDHELALSLLESSGNVALRSVVELLNTFCVSSDLNV